MVDVGLAWDADSIRIEPTTPANLRGVGPGTQWTLSAGWSAPLLARISFGRLSVGPDVKARREGASIFDLGIDTLEVSNATGGELHALWGGKTWRASRLRVFLNPHGKLTLVVRLPLETYLLGVVPGEIGALSDALLEAGRAQAIAARSYTLFYRERRAAEGFDLYGTVEDQLYGPIESEKPAASRCVESTRGKIALANGQAIRANYCSTCGGITAEVWEAWPAASLPYLVSHRDHGSGDWCAASTSYRWREEWSAAEFASDVARFGPLQSVALPAGGVGEVQDVRVESRSRSGRVWRLGITTSTGTIEIPAYAIRWVLRRPGNPGAILRSNLFKVDVRRDPATRRTLAIVASGAGAGHGVGLCQTGAIGMARAGKSAEEILEHYYRGVEIKRFY